MGCPPPPPPTSWSSLFWRPVGRKKDVWNTLSMNIKAMAEPKTGVAKAWKRAVTSWDQVTSGRRSQVRPGARILTIVVKKLTPPRIDENPTRKTEMSHMVWPSPDPGVEVETSLKGG